MKKISTLFFILFLVTHSCLAQKVNYELYIVISPESEIEIIKSNNTEKYLSVYFLPFKVCDYSTKPKFRINKKGKLITSMTIKGFSTPIIKLTYLNENGDNPPKIIEKNQELNMISYDEYFRYGNFENLYDLIKNATNLYVIEDAPKSKDFFSIAKKVKVDLL